MCVRYFVYKIFSDMDFVFTVDVITDGVLLLNKPHTMKFSVVPKGEYIVVSSEPISDIGVLRKSIVEVLVVDDGHIFNGCQNLITVPDTYTPPSNTKNLFMDCGKLEVDENFVNSKPFSSQFTFSHSKRMFKKLLRYNRLDLAGILTPTQEHIVANFYDLKKI